MKKEELSKYIDHTILKPNIQLQDVLKLGYEVIEFGFASACIPPSFIHNLSQEIHDLNICTVVSFPFGYDQSEVKLKACEKAISDGANEIDLVVNIADVKSGLWDRILSEMEIVNNFIHSEGKIVKWIFENSYLNQDEIIELCKLCNISKPDFAKTSTGFGNYGARIEDVLCMKEQLNPNIKIKASGGIRSFDDAMQYIDLGVHRIGTSSGINILKEFDI